MPTRMNWLVGDLLIMNSHVNFPNGLGQKVLTIGGWGSYQHKIYYTSNGVQ